MVAVRWSGERKRELAHVPFGAEEALAEASAARIEVALSAINAEAQLSNALTKYKKQY